MKLLAFILVAVWTGVALATTAVSPGALARQLYEVKEVEGNVYYWEPWSDRWERLELGRQLVEGTLIQVTENGRAVVKVPVVAGQPGLRGSSLVKFLAPSIVRLDEGFLRKIKLSSYFVPMAPSPGKAKDEEEEKKELKMEHTLDEAWNRFIAVLAKFDLNAAFTPPRMPAQEKSGETEWVSKFKPIRVLRPGDKSIVIADKLPAVVKIIWKHPAPGLEYGVHVWGADEARRDAMAHTSLDYYTLEVKQEGRYFVQLATTDGEWQSKAHSVHVALPLTLGTSRGSPLPRIPVENTEDFRPRLQYPVKDFVYLTSRTPATLSFQWEFAQNAAKGESRDVLVIQSAKGIDLVRRNAKAQVVPLSFAAEGAYQWFVERRVDPGEGEEVKTYKSEVRSFRIQPTPRGFSSLLSATTNGVFYLEDY